ncbi:MAG: hypothetical protein ABEJ65_02540 [bacterium]
MIDVEEKGSALVITLWMVALLAAVVSAYALRSMMSIKVSESQNNRARLRTMLESASELWINQVRAEQIETSSGVVITEIMSYAPEQSTRGVVITKVVRNERNKWVELYNASDKRLRLTSITEQGNPLSPIYPLDETLAPGEYAYVCESIECPRFTRRRDVPTIHPKTLLLNKRGSLAVWFREASNRDKRGNDQFGWGRDRPHRYVEAESVEASDSSVAYVRNKTDAGCPVDEQNNQTDFEQRTEPPTPGSYHQCPDRLPPDSQEFIELYNTSSDVKRLTYEDYRIRDEHKNASPSSPTEFELKPHPMVDRADSGVLMPGQTGLVVPESYKVTDRRQRVMIKNGFVKLFLLSPTNSDEVQFLNEGLANRTLQTVTLLTPEDESRDKVLDNGQHWPDPVVKPHRSRIKREPTDSNQPENWIRSDTGGTPGHVRQHARSSNAPDTLPSWGKEREWLPGITMGERLYFPSRETTYQEGDHGYIRLVSMRERSDTQFEKSISNYAKIYEATFEAVVLGDDGTVLTKRQETQTAVVRQTNEGVTVETVTLAEEL